MDVVINSQIQSPLVRTLARTKGKSQSFTHSIADNVPPCSFSKIQIGAQNATETQYGRNYKLKIPQYGYLRDVALKFTTQENTISDKIVSMIKPLFTETVFTLDDVRAAGTQNAATSPGNGGGAAIGGATPNQGTDISWYNLQNIVQATASNNLTAVNFGVDIALAVRNVLAPQFKQLIMSNNTGATASARIGDNGFPADTLGVGTAIPLSSKTTATLTSSLAAMAKLDATYATCYSQMIKLNGNPKLWSEFLRFYMNIYSLAASGNSIASMVWEQLKAEPVQTVTHDLYTTGVALANTTSTVKDTTGATAGIVTNEAGIITEAAFTAAQEKKFSVECTLPRFAVARRKGGKILWVPKLPQLRFDANGSVVGVDFIPLDFIHPNDDDDDLTKLKFFNLSTAAETSKYNYRTFAYGDDNTVDEDWQMWDWQTESFYYQGFAANIAERIQLSTHNRPIQTIFPQELYTRIQKLEPAERARCLKMMKTRVSKSGYLEDNAGSQGHAGEKVTYLPLFLSSTENPSLNFDTRFVEQLDIDVFTRDIKDVFSASDVIAQNTNPRNLYEWVSYYRVTIFGGDYGTVGAPSNTGGAKAFTPLTAATTILTDLAKVKAITAASASYETYNALTPRSYVIDLRSYQSVPANNIKVEALLYFHNFHDTTAQAIRDANFKPGTPASLLSYNTYLETPVALTLSQLQNTEKVNILLTSNNLVFGTSFFIRRRSSVPKKSNKRDHYMQTLRVKSVTLTASGQQIYHSVLDESQITDPFDYDLASGKVGRKYNNSLISQSIDDPYTGESFYHYMIPYGFSSDMTYNSGSIAFQTLNNPVLTIEVDVGKDASQPIDVVVNDKEFEVVVFHNYWQMIRIDSNTGSITRSLDL